MRKGGGASRARARTEYPDAALRQSGPEIPAGNEGKKGFGTEHFHLHLTFQITKKRPSQIPFQVKGLRRQDPPTPRKAPEERNKMATWASPFHPSRRFPPPWCEKTLHAIAAQVPPKNKNPAGR